MAAQNPIPPPGIAAVPRFIAKETEFFTLKRPFATYSWDMRDSAGNLVLSSDPQRFSFSQKTRISDSQGRVLGLLRREWRTRRCTYTFTPNPAAVRHETVSGWAYTHFTRFFHADHFKVRFRDVGGGEEGSVVSVEGITGRSISYKGMPIAILRRESVWSSTRKWRVQIAKGMDVSVVFGAMICADMIARMQRGNGGYSGAAGGGGC